MFLKRIEMQGFKSFADNIKITFDDPVTGIVGPNGCGKSNISDAIRWVLGEQSVKSLRGEKMTDIIFAGSEDRKAMNMAEVTLVFDNSQHLLNSDLDEIELTRRIYNTDQDAEYLINHKNVRYKDILDLVMDTGLGKNSLSMISQGNVMNFADAKPYDRREVFEDAAGVSKYKKRKIESLNKLERTKENLDRTFDILSELERQVSPLKRQARKAELYREMKSKLEQIEVAVLVNDIQNLNDQKNELEKSLFDLETTIAMQETTMQIHENSNFENKNKLRGFDKEINSIQERLMNVINEIQILEARKIEIDEKRKYAIEMGSSEEKIKEMESHIAEAKYEYDDRLERLNKLRAELELLNTNQENTAIELAEASLKKDEALGIVSRLSSRMEILKNVISDPFSSASHSGVQAIMNNKSSFYGIMGVIGQEIHPNEGYEEAIATALAGSVYHIVTKDEEAARKAIAFLKKNRSGRATFLPETVCRIYDLRQEDEIVCSNTKGYLGVAADFCHCSSEFDIVRESLLSNTIVTDNLENANNLAYLLNYRYKIVTLEGDIVHKGGSMTGGKVKNEISLITAQSELKRIENDYVSYQAEGQLAVKKYNDLVASKESLDSQLTEKRIAIAQLEPIVDTKRAKYEKLQSDYDMIIPNKSQETIEDSVIAQLAENYARKDELSTSLKLKREERMKLSADIDRKDQQIRQIRRQFDESRNAVSQINTNKAVVATKLESDLARLASEYQMTYEYALENCELEISEDARNEVISLRKEIQDLGNINMAAPEEFEEINERYEFLKKNYDDLIASRDKILQAIDEMDEIMKTQFTEVFDAINAELPKTFAKLFGGGRARLVLEDPDDILNTGIDIDVQPPGKAVKSIRLFSGGEKALIAICVLFTILKVRPQPLIVFDEIESSLDVANVERFAKYVKEFADRSQFLIITHRPGTMEQCDTLYGVTMQKRGISQLLKVKLVDAIEMAEPEESHEAVS
ncbi:MAG: AAA family ATPase [Erysipelotrichaceae bacterium]|nr:AAA family ATPase [Erysipelotrichaceae bacterium]